MSEVRYWASNADHHLGEAQRWIALGTGDAADTGKAMLELIDSIRQTLQRIQSDLG